MTCASTSACRLNSSRSPCESSSTEIRLEPRIGPRSPSASTNQVRPRALRKVPLRPSVTFFSDLPTQALHDETVCNGQYRATHLTRDLDDLASKPTARPSVL